VAVRQQAARDKQSLVAVAHKEAREGRHVPPPAAAFSDKRVSHYEEQAQTLAVKSKEDIEMALELTARHRSFLPAGTQKARTLILTIAGTPRTLISTITGTARTLISAIAIKSEAIKSEARKSEVIKSEARKSEAIKSEATKSEATKSEATKSKAIKGNQQDERCT